MIVQVLTLILQQLFWLHERDWGRLRLSYLEIYHLKLVYLHGRDSFGLGHNNNTYSSPCSFSKNKYKFCRVGVQSSYKTQLKSKLSTPHRQQDLTDKLIWPLKIQYGQPCT